MIEKLVETKAVDRNVAVALGIICIILAVGIVGAVTNYSSIISGKDKDIATLNTQVTSLNSQTTNLQNQITSLNSQLAGNKTEIASLNLQITNLQNRYNSLNSAYTSYQSSHSHTDTDYNTLNAQIQHVHYLNTSIYSSGLNGSGILLSTSYTYKNGVFNITIGNPTEITLVNCQATIYLGSSDLSYSFGFTSPFSLAPHTSARYIVSYTPYDTPTILAYGYLPQ